MSYVIVKGKSNTALNDFEFNGLPVKSNATMWQMIENPELPSDWDSEMT